MEVESKWAAERAPSESIIDFVYFIEQMQKEANTSVTEHANRLRDDIDTAHSEALQIEETSHSEALQVKGVSFVVEAKQKIDEILHTANKISKLLKDNPFKPAFRCEDIPGLTKQLPTKRIKDGGSFEPHYERQTLEDVLKRLVGDSDITSDTAPKDKNTELSRAYDEWNSAKKQAQANIDAAKALPSVSINN